MRCTTNKYSINCVIPNSKSHYISYLVHHTFPPVGWGGYKKQQHVFCYRGSKCSSTLVWGDRIAHDIGGGVVEWMDEVFVTPLGRM